jgi:hypothetical protein
MLPVTRCPKSIVSLRSPLGTTDVVRIDAQLEEREGERGKRGCCQGPVTLRALLARSLPLHPPHAFVSQRFG